MRTKLSNTFQSVFPSCRRILGNDTWAKVLAAVEKDPDIQTYPDTLQALKADLNLPDYIDDLSRIELAKNALTHSQALSAKLLEETIVNPTLSLIPVAWKHLAALIHKDECQDAPPPEPGKAHVLVWRHDKTGNIRIRDAMDIDLLALKIVVDRIEPKDASYTGGVDIESIQLALDAAVNCGILFPPESHIQRNFSSFLPGLENFSEFQSANMFTLQWHITQACDLHCRHCYDRSDRPPMTTGRSMAVLDDLEQFCRKMHVRGQVTFTGGNPLLHPDFAVVYKAARDRGFSLAILGNPTPVGQIENLLGIAKPVFFQVSLEGLEKTNDFMRGKGHFQRTIGFLKQLRRLGIYSMVMLTLTRDNLNQVIPLGNLLRDKTDSFTFNRLSCVGEGARLLMPKKKDFEAFLRKYTAEAKKNPVLHLKDNLINILHQENGTAYFGGCTGYGCGAAFNFLALLSDGEVHACRKFPSCIGNIREDTLLGIYHSAQAEAYRTGGDACQGCLLSPVCRGCLAVTHSCGMDVFKDKDPFCFIAAENAL